MTPILESSYVCHNCHPDIFVVHNVPQHAWAVEVALESLGHMLQVDNIFIDNDGLTASVAENLCVDLTLFLTNIDGLPWDSTSFGQKEQKDPNCGSGNNNNNNCMSHCASAAWLHSSVQSGSAGSSDMGLASQHPSIISTYCPQVCTAG